MDRGQPSVPPLFPGPQSYSRIRERARRWRGHRCALTPCLRRREDHAGTKSGDGRADHDKRQGRPPPPGRSPTSSFTRSCTRPSPGAGSEKPSASVPTEVPHRTWSATGRPFGTSPWTKDLCKRPPKSPAPSTSEPLTPFPHSAPPNPTVWGYGLCWGRGSGQTRTNFGGMCSAYR